MNIFWLSKDPKKCAEYHCDKHVVKMIVEYTQLLSTAIRIWDGLEVPMGRKVFYLLKGEELNLNAAGNPVIVNQNPNVYLPTHINHPCSIWTRTSLRNWFVLHELALQLCIEYTRRYGKIHKCRAMLAKMPLPSLEDGPFTDPPQTMPDEFKHPNTVTAYRQFYVGSKSRFAQWKYTKIPDWYRKKLAAQTKS